MKTFECNPHYKQIRGKKSHGHLIRCGKSLWQKSNTIAWESIWKDQGYKNITKHNKGNIQQAYRQHQIKWRETRAVRQPKKFKADTTWKEWDQTFAICWREDSIHKWH